MHVDHMPDNTMFTFESVYKLNKDFWIIYPIKL